MTLFNLEEDITPYYSGQLAMIISWDVNNESLLRGKSVSEDPRGRNLRREIKIFTFRQGEPTPPDTMVSSHLFVAYVAEGLHWGYFNFYRQTLNVVELRTLWASALRIF